MAYVYLLYVSSRKWDHLGTIWGPLGTIWDLWGPSGDHLGTIWDMDSMKLSISLRNWTFRSARIDPSRRAIAEGYIYVRQNPYKQIKYPKRVGKTSKTAKHGIA